MVGEAEQEVAGVRQTHMSFEWSDGTGESDFNELLGKLVRITGLTGRPELNGRLGAPRSPTPHLHLHPHNACTKVLRASSRTEVRFPHACRGMRWLAMYSWHGCSLQHTKQGNRATASPVQAEYIAGTRRRAGPASCWCSMSKATVGSPPG